MVLHEFPEGVVTYLQLLRGGFAPARALWLALLALSGGALLYVGATHLLPNVEHERRPHVLAAPALGVVTALGITMSEH